MGIFLCFRLGFYCFPLLFCYSLYYIINRLLIIFVIILIIILIGTVIAYYIIIIRAKDGFRVRNGPNSPVSGVSLLWVLYFGKLWHITLNIHFSVFLIDNLSLTFLPASEDEEDRTGGILCLSDIWQNLSLMADIWPMAKMIFSSQLRNYLDREDRMRSEADFFLHWNM